MPLRHKSAQKRARQAIKRTERNKFYKAKVKTAIKKVLAASNKENAEKELKSTVSILDKVASKGVIHRNQAANQKSRLVRYVNKMK